MTAVPALPRPVWFPMLSRLPLPIGEGLVLAVIVLMVVMGR